MRDDFGDDGGMFDGGDDLQGAAGALLDVDLEHPVEQPSSAYSNKAAQTVNCGVKRWSG
jgi:hypothetical protein